MKPDAPHSFVPRNPAMADGRIICACGLTADADCHLASMLAAQLGKCTDCLERPTARKGRCWKCYKATLPGSSDVTLSTTLSAKMAVEAALAASRLGVSRSAWIRVQLLKALGADAPGHADQ